MFLCKNLPRPFLPLFGSSLRAFMGRGTASSPFDDALEPLNTEDLGLSDFANYRPAPQNLESVSRFNGPVVITLRLSDPYTNLALEEYIFQEMPPTAYRLMTYINGPCCVIGKNQNPWNEVNIAELKRRKIPLVRRRSGGGTVVHDLGNLNYSVMVPQYEFDRVRFSKVIIESTRSLCGLKNGLTVNPRGDIITRDIPHYKVGGSAYRVSRGKSYHHGTLLLSLDLELMRYLLAKDIHHGQGQIISSGAVESVPSPVVNAEMSSDDVQQALSEGFAKEYTESETMISVEINLKSRLPDAVSKIVNELIQWKWTFGNSPSFRHVFNHENGLVIEFCVKKWGILEKVALKQVNCNSADFKAMKCLLVPLQQHIQDHVLEYRGSDISRLIPNEEMANWVLTILE